MGHTKKIYFFKCLVLWVLLSHCKQCQALTQQTTEISNEIARVHFYTKLITICCSNIWVTVQVSFLFSQNNVFSSLKTSNLFTDGVLSKILAPLAFSFPKRHLLSFQYDDVNCFFYILFHGFNNTRWLFLSQFCALLNQATFIKGAGAVVKIISNLKPNKHNLWWSFSNSLKRSVPNLHTTLTRCEGNIIFIGTDEYLVKTVLSVKPNRHANLSLSK